MVRCLRHSLLLVLVIKNKFKQRLRASQPDAVAVAQLVIAAEPVAIHKRAVGRALVADQQLALARHEQHVGKIHASWSRSIGLSSRRLSRRTRYAPNDRLLKSIVVAIVDDRMQFDEFLADRQKRLLMLIEQATGKAAFVLHWKSLRRQVRVRGPVEIVPEAMSDAYFASRPRDARIGAWASQQSRPLESRFALEKAVAKFAAKYPVGEVPRPPGFDGTVYLSVLVTGF